MDTPPVRVSRRTPEGLRWDGVPLKAYKPAGTHFKDVTRQVLFGADDDEGLATQVRYFEVGPGGHTTLEQHAHVHAVMIVSGAGRVIVGEAICDVAPFDAVYVPPSTWHQFRAGDEGLGFLCLVPCERDRPIRPDAEAARRLRANPTVAGFIRL